MRQIRAAACLAIFILVGLANAVEQDQREAAADAKDKSEVLEKKASAEGSKTLPTPAEIITKQPAQSIDPSGEKALDDAVTCLARSIYWEADRKNKVEMEAIANVVINGSAMKVSQTPSVGLSSKATNRVPVSSRGGAMVGRMMQVRTSRTHTSRKSPARPSTDNSRTGPMELSISTIAK